MARLDKGTLALTFKFDCDRFLRLRLATDEEKSSLGVSRDTYKRPGIELIKAAGRKWEAEKYQDLIDVSKDEDITYLLDDYVDGILERKPFKSVDNLFEILRQYKPPKAIIEAQFSVPENITPSLKKAYVNFELDQVRVRPDILWIRPGQTGAPLIGTNKKPEYEIHIVDVKMAAEPSLRHFTEVTYYALALAAALEQEGLDNRYAVSAEGMIWPGSHDMNSFKNNVQFNKAGGAKDPVSDALDSTLIRVPYEVYEVHVKQFFENRLFRVLNTDVEKAAWHVGPKCQLCDYVRYCKEQANNDDHLSRISWLNQGQADLLRSNGIETTRDLSAAISSSDARWQSVTSSSHQLRAESAALEARARSLSEGVPVPIHGRKSAMMPAWTDQSIFITIHFDPGSGIAFAIGASRLYFPHDREKGDAPVTEENIFIIDRVDAMNPETERERLKEFTLVVSEWLEEVSLVNSKLPARERQSSHIFFWNMLEVRQLKRMIERHMQHEEIIDLLDVLARFFPPDNLLPDPDAFKSQPGTIVKEVLRTLIGLPLAHDYSLFDVANNFFPNVTKEGRTYKFDLPFGFKTPMSDQIPFERAYELWQDKIFVRHFNSSYPTEPSKWRPYTRDELYRGIRKATRVHLNALQHVVRKLREKYEDKLLLKKGGFSASRSSQAKVPEAARSLIAFEKLNVACQEIENRATRALPVDEREAKFFSIRGLSLMRSETAAGYIRDLVRSRPEYQNQSIYIFNFPLSSRDSRIKEGEFTLALSNEEEYTDLDEPWRLKRSLNFSDAQDLLKVHGLTDTWMVNKPIGGLLQVEVVKLEAMRGDPYIILKPAHKELFEFAVKEGFIDFNSPLVLDPIHRDFSTQRIEKALRAVGGKPAQIKKNKKRRY